MSLIISTYEEAVAFVDARIGQGLKPGLERIAGLLEVMGNPHTAYPVVHVAGTNGKTTTVRMISDLLGAHGLRVGAFTSPHLHRVEERYSLSGRPFDEEQFTAAVADVAPFVELYEERSGQTITYFELTVAIAMAAFADAAVDVAVFEVGLGGRWDATNVVHAAVSVITGIAMDHMSYLGDSLPAIAAEKAAILKEGGTLVTGELPAAAEGAVTAQVSETGSRWIRYGTDFGLRGADQAVGGWLADLDGLFGEYDQVYLPLHGRHQAGHLLTSIVAVEALFQRALDAEALGEAVEALTSPGRLEVVQRHPIVLLDGAHNTEGMEGLATTLRDEFPQGPWTIVVGMRGERSPADLMSPLRDVVGAVFATAPDDMHAIDAETVAEAARLVFGRETPVEVVASVPEAVRRAMDAAGETGRVAVTGSLYVVGEARHELLPRGTALPGGVHVRIEAAVDDGHGFEFDDEEIYDDDDYESEDFGSDLS